MRLYIRLAALIGILLAAYAALAGSPTLPASSVPNFTLLMIGQSNTQGQNPLPPSPLLMAGAREEHVAWCFYLDRTWAQLQDPYCGGPSYYPDFANPNAGASIAPGIARRIMPTVGNVAFIPSAKGGSAIGSWLYRPSGGMSYLDMAVEQAKASGQTPDLAYWYQGETDSKPSSGTTGVQYKAYLAQIADRIYAEFGCPLMVTAIQTNDPPVYGNQRLIQQAQRESWAEVPHVVQGPDLADITCAPENAVHLAHPAKIDLVAARGASAILAWKAAQ
jgi:hypothetical protein